MDLSLLVMAVVAAVVYALSGLFKSLPNGETIDKVKFVATVLFGGVVGIIVAYMGLPIDERNITVALATYAGLLAVFENIVKGVYRYLKDKDLLKYLGVPQ